MCEGFSFDVLAVGRAKRGGIKVWVGVTEEGVQSLVTVNVHPFFCFNHRISDGLVFRDWWQKQIQAKKIPFFLNNQSSDFARAHNFLLEN